MRSFGMYFVIAGYTLSAFAADIPTQIHPQSLPRLKEISPSELKIAPAKPGASPPKQNAAARPAVNPALGVSRAPDEAAAARAADRKDPSGAIIIKGPAVTNVKP